MTVVADRERRPGEASGAVFRKEPLRFRLGPEARETLAVFAVAYAAYAALGIRVTVEQHVVPFDGMVRLAHAYFVWWNSPPKLAAVGFVWPPLATLVYLPLALVKPLATSLVALPLTSAFFQAGMLATLLRVFALAGMRRGQRLALVAAFAVNPMIAYYAANGMSEAVYLFFLTVAVHQFMRWYLTRQARFLIVASVAFSLGVLSRYELITWAVVLTAVVVVALIRQHVTRREVEGTVIAYLAPISYGVFLWLFFNWLIIGDPLFWLRHQAPGAPANVPGARGGTIALAVPAHRPSVHHVLVQLVSLNWRLFPLTLFVTLGLVALVVARRDLMALALTVALVLNASFTGLLVYVSHAESYFQLRYNMRAMPLAMVGVGWLYLAARRSRWRDGVWAVALLVVVASLPLTWRTMQTYPIQYLEQAFTRAVATGRNQEGTSSIGGYGVGIAGEQRMARYVLSLHPAPNSILTDDAQTFSVMLLSGRPDLFVDRIDHGDVRWLEVLRRPWGRVRYLLVSDSPDDVIRAVYPNVLAGGVPGVVPVHRISTLVLLRVAGREPHPGR